MGRYFAIAQGFEEDISMAISDHYLPIGISSDVPKKPISFALSIIDKLDTLVGFFLINEKPTWKNCLVRNNSKFCILPWFAIRIYKISSYRKTVSSYGRYFTYW